MTKSMPPAGLPGSDQVPPFINPEALAELNKLSRGLKIEMRPVDGLKPNPRNARKHSECQIIQLAASMRQFGFTNPIVVDEHDKIVAGHGRFAAARVLGLAEVPVIELTHLSEAQKRAMALADNRLSDLSGWDEDLLRIELEELSALDLDFDIEITGFDTSDLDKLLAPAAPAPKEDPADNIPEVASEVVSRVGDVWILGPHRLICGSALEPDVYKALLEGDLAQMVFTDPPFNVRILGHVTGKAHREFLMASGEMTRDEFMAFLGRAAANMAAHSVDGSIHYICMDWRHVVELLAAMAPVYAQPKNLCVWTKTNGGMGSFYRSQHELVFVFKKGDASHINNFGLGQGGRYRTNVWNYPGVNVFGRNRDAELAMHPTVKPVALVADAIKDCSKRNGIILDPFGGSGTTLIAAEKTRRKARLIELDPLYCDVIVRRWQGFTGGSAMLAGANGSFETIRDRRMAGGTPTNADEPSHCPEPDLGSGAAA